MASMLRSLTKRLFVLLTFAITALFLLSCAAWFIEPGKHWYIALLGVGFAFLFFATCTMLIFWIVLRSKWFLLPMVAMAIGWKPINAFIAFHPLTPQSLEKNPSSLRVMQWNVARFDEMRGRPRSGKSKRKQILDYIRKENPDIICMQEFLETNDSKLFDENIPYFRDSLGYRYFYYAMDHRRPDRVYEHGIAIFSKYPIRKTHRRKFGGPREQKADESFIYVDIAVNGKMIRVFTTHLQSLLFTNAEFRKFEEIKQGGDSTIEKSRDIFLKFRNAYGFRQQQAEMIRRELDASPHPAIICGDFNDVPNSFVYHRIKGNRKDAFTRRGFGIGRTYSALSPTLRIDYIMTGQEIGVLQCRNPHPALSDHFPVIADLRLPD